MHFRQSSSIPASHPALDGHFPNNPIVPGVVILESVQQAIEAWQGKVRLESMHSVKFLNPLLPDHEYMIRLDMKESNINIINFKCVEGTVQIAQGSLTFYRNN